MAGSDRQGYSGLEDAELIRLTQSGDRAAFGKLVNKYMRRAYYGALGLVGSHDDALDLSQEAFARAFQARGDIDPERPFYTWYYQILRRLCFNLGRDSRARAEKLEQQGDWLVAEVEQRADQSPEQSVEDAARQAAVRAAVDALPAAEREIIVMREFQEMKYDEIAELLDIPKGTVMSRLYNARKRLAAALVEGGVDDE